MRKSIYVTIVSLLLLPGAALAGDYGASATAGAAGLDKTARGSLSDVIGNVIGSGLTLIGVLFFILMIYAGISWMLARGNEEQSKKALNTVTGAIIGLILVIAAYAITLFVFRSVSGQAPTPPPPPPQTCPSPGTPTGSGCVGQNPGDQCTNAGTNQTGTCTFDSTRNGCLCQ